MSESPEEQPSTGVLGRIGSWFSPWKGKGPTSPTENASRSSDLSPLLEGDEGSEKSGRPQAGEKLWQDKNEHSSSPTPLTLSGDSFLCEEKDATQSAHRHGSAGRSTETGEGGPKEEEFVACQKKKTGQGKESEERSNSTSASGIPERNASHLTHLSSSSKQGAAWDSDQAHAQPQGKRQAQAQAGKRLHVYLEETSVIQGAENISATQEVVRTKVAESLQALSKSSQRSDSPKPSSTKRTENKRTNVRPAIGSQSYYSALVGLSLKSHKDTELETAPDKEQTDSGSMGRKNTARRRIRKNSQGDGGTSPQEKMSPNAQPVTEGFPSSDNSETNPQGKSPKANKGESFVNSTSTHHPASQTSPEGGESHISCPDNIKQLDNFQDSNSVTADTLVHVVGGSADMEDDESLYKVERKTETPESKRRSMKVSQSEVKLFTKSVTLKAMQSPAAEDQDHKSALKNKEDKEEEKAKTKIDARLHDPKTSDEESKLAVGQITDKINLFEQREHKLTFQTPRSADVSPVRKGTERLKADFELTNQRSKSADCNRSSSASPIREKPLTIKERMKNFTPASKSALPQKPAMTGMSHKFTVTVATSELPELDSQGRLDSKEQKETTVSEIKLKPDGQDTTPAGVENTTQQRQPTESTPKDTVALKTADKQLKPTNLQSTVPSKEAGDSSDPKLIDTVALKTTDQSTKHNSVESDVPAKDDANSETTDAVALKTRDHGSRSNSVDSEMKTKGAGVSSISKTTDSVALKTTDANTKPNSIESDALTIGLGDSLEMASNVSPQTKGPSRTGSRSKRKKGKEPTSPMSLNRENKPTSKQEVTAIKQEQVDDTVETVSTSKQLTQKVSLSSDKAGENTAEKQSRPETKQKDLKKEVEVLKKEKHELDSTSKKDSVDKPGKRKEGPPEPSFLKDEPDTAASNRETEKPIEKDPGILPKKEEKKGHSVVVTSASKKSKDAAASSPSPAVIKPIEKTPSVEQESPVETPKLDKESPLLPDSKNQGNAGPQSKKDKEQKSPPRKKDTEPITSAEVKDVGKPQKTNQTEKKEKEKPQQLLSSDRNTTGEKVSDSRPGISGTEESAAQNKERKNAGGKEQPQPIKDIKKPEANPPEPASQSPGLTSASSDSLPAQAQHAGQMVTAHPEKAVICANTQTDEPVSGTKSNTGPSKAEASTDVPAQKSIENSKAEAKPVEIAEESQTNSVSVEKTENSPDDSHTHGANDVGTTVTTAADKVTVKAANDTQAQKNIETESVTGKQSAIKSASSQGEGQDEKNSTVKTFPLEDKISGDINKLAASLSLKGAEEIPQSHSNSEASKPTINVAMKTAEKTLSLQVKEPPLVAHGDISPHPQLLTTKKEPFNNKPSPTSKPPTSPEAHKMSPDSIQHLPKKKLHLPRGLSKDDFAMQQDAPSSWLDVDFPKRKMKVQQPKLSSAGSESNLLDGELDDDDFIEKIKKLCAPFSLPPRKHNHLRPPQPSFAMPAIKEDRFEKTFDPEEFKFGLRKKNNFTLDTPPSLLAKLQSVGTKAGLKPARASLADRSVLLSSLDTDSWLKDQILVKDEADTKEEKDDKIKLKSRLEGSCVFSSLTSSSIRGKRNGVETKEEGSSSEDGSASKTPRLSSPPLSQLQPPFPTTAASMKDTLGQQQSSALSSKEEAQAAEAVVSDSGPPLPSFNDIKLPDYLEKLIHREHEKPVQSTQAQEQVNNKAIGKMTTPVPEGEALKPGLLLPDAGPSCFPVTPPSKQPTLPEQPQRTLHNHIRTDKGFHKRPGKMVLFEKAEFSGQAYEIYRDVADSTSLQLSPLISVKVVRGCWVLYEKPNFQGRLIALEEGGTELTNMWAEPGLETKPMVIGSIRLAVWDYCIPHIDLFTEPEGRGRVTPYHDDTIETGSFGIPMNTASIQVHAGVWLVFSDPGFQGMLTVLETGVYPFPETWGFSSPFVGSLRPLKMGAFKVENPDEIKAVVYEKPGFQGSCLEIDNDLFGFCEDEEDITADCTSLVSQKLKSVGSLKITGGLWVGYSQPGFEGQQFILEEGEFLDCNDWGGSGQLLSLRPVLADFMSPHLKMFSDRDFGELGMNINLSVPVINMDDTGYGMRTQSIDVIGGVWVVFEEPGFCGESYILEKGLYGNPEDWGALQPRVASAMPVLLDDFQHASKFKVQIFSDPGFQGSVLYLDEGMASLQDGFSVASCKVLAGSWLAFEGQDFTGRMYVLDVGNYPDLRAMGCVHPSSSILSLQTVGFEFSLPSITLFERCGLRGKRVVLTDGSVNLQLTGGCSRVQSVLVEGGMWVLYDGVNYRGGQILLKPGEILDWRKFSSWQKIGSLRPLMQKQVHFRVRNRQTGLMMSVTGDLEDVKLLRIQETEETDGLEQIWSYQNGHLHCKLLEECCLSPSGSVTMAGSRMGLSPEPDHQIHLWSITPEGFIRYTPTSDLVLEVKGGHHYDKNQVILNTLDPNKQQQRWNVEII